MFDNLIFILVARIIIFSFGAGGFTELGRKHILE
jgi:hypothetical protein